MQHFRRTGDQPILDDAAIDPQRRAMIFISYARADRPRVVPLAEVLTARGYDVWWDALIEGGAGFAHMIEAKLEAADVVIVVWSAASIGSDWVRDEAAHGRDRKRIVPVSLDGAEPPLGFRQYHTVDLRNWRGRADAPEIDSVVAGLKSVAAGAPVAATARSASQGVSRRTALVAGGGAVAAIAGGLYMFNPFASGRSANSIAVLPFLNLSGDNSQVYFSDGLSEEIRSTLSRNPELKVAAPTSTNTFRDRTTDTKVIGSKLGVAFLLEGSVRRAGDVVRIAAELIDTASGFSKWSQSFDRKLTDVFAVQTEIASVVAGELAVRVSTGKPMPGGTTNVAAYDAYLKGKAAFNADAGEASDRLALADFDAALAADPGFAGAHAARSRSLAAIASQYAKANDLRAMYNAAIAAAERAVDLAPELAAAQLALGYAIYTGRLDIDGARSSYDRAAKLGTGDADIQLLFALYCARSGRPAESLAAADRAVSLDPLNARAFRSAGNVRYVARRYEEALPLLEKALELNPKINAANALKGNALLMLQRYREARDAYAVERNAMNRFAGLAITERKLGNQAAAKQAMASLIHDVGDSALYQQAQVLSQWGDADAAFATLERAKTIGDSGLLFSGTDPLLDPVRKDPRFEPFLKSIMRT